MLLTALKSLLPRVKGIAPTNRIAVVVLLSICCFFPQDISAQSLSTLEIELKKERKSNFMFTGTLSAESNLQQGTDESTHVSRINMIPRYKLNSKNILGADMTYVKTMLRALRVVLIMFDCIIVIKKIFIMTMKS